MENQNKLNPKRARQQVPVSMDIENVQHMDECSPKHMHMRTVRLK